MSSLRRAANPLATPSSRARSSTGAFEAAAPDSASATASPLDVLRAFELRAKVPPDAATITTKSSEQLSPEKQSALELRRRRNRDSMRRARSRQRSEQEQLETAIEQLEARLERLLRAKQEDRGGAALDAYSALLRETEQLRAEQDELGELTRRHAHFRARLAKLADQERKAQEAELLAVEAQEDSALLRPLLGWVTPAATEQLVAFARERLLEVAELTDALAPTTQSLLGWQGKRAIRSNWAHYMMSKSFPLESAQWLAKRTWDCTVNSDVAEMKQVLVWANGTRVLHRLSPDAVVLARDMNIPNLQDPDHPIRLRYILLVFRTELPDNRGFLVGTETLNVHGTSVEECLEQTISHATGMHSLTMYGFHFARIPDERGGGCHVTLAGRSSDGSLMYARKVLFEVLPSILRWENTFVAPILRVAG